jgi:hypothetical protein
MGDDADMTLDREVGEWIGEGCPSLRTPSCPDDDEWRGSGIACDDYEEYGDDPM